MSWQQLADGPRKVMGHACEYETAMVMALRPELVRASRFATTRRDHRGCAVCTCPRTCISGRTTERSATQRATPEKGRNASMLQSPAPPRSSPDFAATAAVADIQAGRNPSGSQPAWIVSPAALRRRRLTPSQEHVGVQDGQSVASGDAFVPEVSSRLARARAAELMQ
jgi:hypothetical protein